MSFGSLLPSWAWHPEESERTVWDKALKPYWEGMPFFHLNNFCAFMECSWINLRCFLLADPPMVSCVRGLEICASSQQQQSTQGTPTCGLSMGSQFSSPPYCGESFLTCPFPGKGRLATRCTKLSQCQLPCVPCRLPTRPSRAHKQIVIPSSLALATQYGAGKSKDWINLATVTMRHHLVPHSYSG